MTHVTHSGDRPLFVLFLPQTCVRVGAVWPLVHGSCSFLNTCWKEFHQPSASVATSVPVGCAVCLSACCDPRSLLFTADRTGSFSFIITGQKRSLLAKLVSRKPIGGKMVRNVGGEEAELPVASLLGDCESPSKLLATLNLSLVHYT